MNIQEELRILDKCAELEDVSEIRVSPELDAILRRGFAYYGNRWCNLDVTLNDHEHYCMLVNIQQDDYIILEEYHDDD